MTVAKNYEAVKSLIEKYPELVDDDQRLVVNFWIGEIYSSGSSIYEMLAIDLLEIIKRGKLTNYDTITRMRRLVEEKCPHLRGKTWAERQRIKEKKIKSEIVSL
jgi:hypothetical protein